MMINAAQRRHSANAFTSSSNLNVSLNIGIAFIQRWRARQLVEGWHLYRAVPGASSWLTANDHEQRLGLGFFFSAIAFSWRHHASSGRDPAVSNRPIRTLSVLGMHATGGANPRRSTVAAGLRADAATVRHSVMTPNV